MEIIVHNRNKFISCLAILRTGENEYSCIRYAANGADERTYCALVGIMLGVLCGSCNWSSKNPCSRVSRVSIKKAY